MESSTPPVHELRAEVQKLRAEHAAARGELDDAVGKWVALDARVTELEGKLERQVERAADGATATALVAARLPSFPDAGELAPSPKLPSVIVAPETPPATRARRIQHVNDGRRQRVRRQGALVIALGTVLAIAFERLAAKLGLLP